MIGRRRPDQRGGDLPDDLQRGDYWKLVRSDGVPLRAGEPSNLTGTIWQFVSPNGGVGTLAKHTVREHEDGTITVAPNDGSSNSILYYGGDDGDWHGYIDRGRWYET